jgi:hypothetical protein
LKPPYLINRSSAGGAGCVSVTADVNAGVVEIAIRGHWTPALRMQAWAAVSKCFAECPRAVVVDLHDLDDPLAASAPAWWTMGMTGVRMAPPVSVAVCLAPASALAARLNRLGAKRYLPVFATMTEARRAVASRLPLTERVQASLAAHPDALNLAGDLLAAACQAWQLPGLLHRTSLIMAELVGNAVEHAGTDILVTASRRGSGIHLAVNDHDPRLPVLLDPEQPEVRGHGLRSVHAAATVWGAMPTDTGKVVWALVRPDPAPPSATTGVPPSRG